MSADGASLAVTRRPAEPAGAPRAERDRRARRRWALAFVLGWLAQVGVRVWLASGQTLPVATPDESGYLFAARVLTGGPDADMSYGTVYRAGYPLLLLPAAWAGDDPVTVYRGALVINALISAAMLPLAFLVLRRLRVAARPAYLFAHVTALLPGVLFYSLFVLTDAILPVLVVGWLLLAHAWLAAPRDPEGRGPSVRLALYGTGGSLLVGFAYASHSRGAILLVVHAVVLLAGALLRRRSWRATILAGAVAAAAALAGALLNRIVIIPNLYPAGDNDLGGNLAERLTTVDGWGWMLSLGTGQVWYQAVATGGVAAIGLAAAGYAVLRRDMPVPVRVLALAVLATVAGTALATSAALPVEYRVGNYVYGRYLACVTPVLFMAGVAVLLRAPRRRALPAAIASAAALTVLTACVVQWYAGDLLSEYTFTIYDFPETSFLTWDWDSFHLWHATLAGLAILAAATGAVLLPRHGPPVLAAVLTAVALAMTITAVDRIARPLVAEQTTETDLRGSVDLRTRDTIAVDWNVPWTMRLSHYYWAWWSEGTLFDSRWTPPPQDADMIVLAWPNGAPATDSWPGGAPSGWEIVDSRRTPEGNWVAWARD
ncbi:hypothetical protein [Actinomadura algeriensis]|uniref:4-amino-4-deoxy-L-arabinose transferase-like glycosyltransferase n=1 Tax=Actinomadura algeriensis TaxID=1679523 RepID=A0ABR9JU03_9ACTN|nr:hypothetical protein [Actinomadura algeriensis]MBE1534038.1 hypothetical protein [Actinomadura algeriensis]